MSRRKLLIAGAVSCLGGAAYALGYVTADRGLFPKHYVERAQEHIGVFFGATLPAGMPSTRTLSTIFARLRLDETAVPVSRSGAGGGMTSLGNDVLLLTHDGTIFSVTGTTLRRSRISVPDNGLDAYKAAAKTARYQGFRHLFEYFRYNDILYYADAAQAGLVVSYTEWLGDRQCYGTTIAHLRLSAADDTVEEIEARADKGWEIIHRTRPCLPLKRTFRAIEGHQAGGRMAYRSPGRLLLGSGDYHWDGLYGPKALSQSGDNDYGKILEIDIAGKTARHVSRGHRNIQGLLVDKSGRTWAVEHGPRGGDELNLIADGGNYGWPEATLGTRYNGLPWPGAKQYGRHDTHSPPVFSWVPSIATSNITQIENFDPSWDGDLLVASLKARSLFRLRVRDGRVVFSEPIPIGQRIRYAHQHRDGRIYLLTDSRRLIVVSKDETTPTRAFIARAVEALDLDPPRERRLVAAIESCGACHAFGAEDESRAPDLGAVYGRRIASGGFPSYSKDLAGHRGRWTEAELRKYLADPHAYAPGTTMPPPNLTGETIADLIAVLKALKAPE